VVIEAKITEDDGTARDKVTRVQHLERLDLLQKSSEALQIQVVETGHEVQSQAESSPSVSILLRQDSEHFQFPNHVLTHDSAARQFPILLLLLPA
jgi:hypothetical protein